MTVYSVTGVTPNMAMLGRDVLVPATLISNSPDENATVTVPFVSNLRDTLHAAHKRCGKILSDLLRLKEVLR